MASTVAQAFDEFEAELRPTTIQRALIADRRTVTAGYLNESFGSSSGMQLLSTKVIGSADRQTIIRPIGDIDVLAVLRMQPSTNTKRTRASFSTACAMHSTTTT